MSKLRYALIGCGRIAPHHIAAALACDQLRITALCDRKPETCQKLIREFHLTGVSVYSDHQEMLDCENPELAAIAVDSGSHAGIACDCVEHGVHVIVEKPIALSLEDADRLIALAEEKGVQVCVCHQNRFNKAVTRLRGAIEEGSLGRLYHLAAAVRWNRNEAYYQQAAWRGRWASDGGALMNQCIHSIDLLRWMACAPAEEVFAYTDRLAHPYIEAEDLGLALVRFQGGTYGIIEGTTNVYPANLEETLAVFGEKGTVRLGGRSVNRLEVFRTRDSDGEEEAICAHYSEEPASVYGFGHKALYRDAVDAIQCGRAPLVDGRAGREALELVLAIYLSAARGEPVRLPLKTGSSAEFEGRFG